MSASTYLVLMFIVPKYTCAGLSGWSDSGSDLDADQLTIPPALGTHVTRLRNVIDESLTFGAGPELCSPPTG